jgi:glycosyltransferase involved in cell wall biosynthesis
VLHGETGFLTAERDVPAAAEYLVDLVEDANLRARLGAAGRSRWSSLYTWDVSLSRLQRAVDSVAR